MATHKQKDQLRAQHSNEAEDHVTNLEACVIFSSSPQEQERYVTKLALGGDL